MDIILHEFLLLLSLGTPSSVCCDMGMSSFTNLTGYCTTSLFIFCSPIRITICLIIWTVVTIMDYLNTQTTSSHLSGVHAFFVIQFCKYIIKKGVRE